MKKLYIIFFSMLISINFLHAEINQNDLTRLLKISLKLKRYMYIGKKKKIILYSKKFEEIKEKLEKEGNLLENVQDPNLLQYIGLSYVSPTFLFYSGVKKPNYELGLKFFKKSINQGNLTSYCFLYKIEKKLKYPKTILDDLKTKIFNNGLEEKCNKLMSKF